MYSSTVLCTDAVESVRAQVGTFSACSLSHLAQELGSEDASIPPSVTNVKRTVRPKIMLSLVLKESYGATCCPRLP